ncbi:MAG: hypothetical protein B6I36_02250 [Desulfobacteraceae bacterium 4572_35.1]|nr:MAG: hypothetical protein B6I36_02250 [Desulfobacteraceae bacterium 4572_35.1]
MEETTLNQKTLIASDTYDPVLKKQTIGTGIDLIAGTILGRVTASRKLLAYAAASNDGSQNPVGVLMEDASAAASDVDAVVGFPGAYVKGNMIGLDQAGEDALEARGIIFI